jgi:hypothetical protein
MLCGMAFASIANSVNLSTLSAQFKRARHAPSACRTATVDVVNTQAAGRLKRELNRYLNPTLHGTVTSPGASASTADGGRRFNPLFLSEIQNADDTGAPLASGKAVAAQMPRFDCPHERQGSAATTRIAQKEQEPALTGVCPCQFDLPDGRRRRAAAHRAAALASGSSS